MMPCLNAVVADLQSASTPIDISVKLISRFARDPVLGDP